MARVTLRDLASKLGVDHSTVSLALRNHPRISAATRERIQRAARASGYQPDPMLAALSHYRHRKTTLPVQGELAWLNHWPEPTQLRAFQEFDRCWQGAKERALQSGYRLEEHVWDTPDELLRVQRTLLARNVPGILIPSQSRLPDWGNFPWEKFAVVRLGYSVANLPTHTVASDQVAASLLAVGKLLERGYRRIGFVHSHAGRNFLYHAGFLQAQSRFGPEQTLPSLGLVQTTGPAAQGQVEAWVKSYRPDVVLTYIAEMAEMLHAAGRRVPDEVAVAAFSIHDGRAGMGIEQHSPDIGRYAVDTLISLINHGQRGIPAVLRCGMVQGSWVDAKPPAGRPPFPEDDKGSG